MVQFEDVRRKRKADLAWVQVRGASFPRVRKVKDDFGDVGPDQPLFFDSLRKTLVAAHKGSVEKIAGFYSAAGSQLRLFVYLPTQQILPVELAVGPTLRAWLETLAADFAGGERGLEFALHESGHNMSALREESVASLESNPVDLLVGGAPPSYRRGDETKRKAAHLAKLVARRGPASKTSPAALDRAFQAFLAARKHKKAPPKDMDARLEALEARFDEKLPTALKVLYRRADGGKGLFFGHDMLSLRALEEQWSMWREIYDEWTLDDLTGNSSAQRGITQGLYSCPKWIPFVDLGGGNFLALDLLPGPKGSVGQVIVFGRDVDTIRRVSPDVKSFVDQCLAFDGEKGVLANVFTSLRL